MLTRSPMKRRYRPTGPSSDVVDALLERAGYSCECCGDSMGDQRGVDWSVHHRRPRKVGGTTWPGINLPSNLLVVCGSGATGCHGEIESRRHDSLECGYLIPFTADPAFCSVLIADQRWCYLGDDFRYHDNPPERAA